MSQVIDWKTTGYMSAAGLAVLGIIRKIVAPFAVQQVKDAMMPEFNKLHERIDGIAATVAALEQNQTKLSVENAYLRGRAGI